MSLTAIAEGVVRSVLQKARLTSLIGGSEPSDGQVPTYDATTKKTSWADAAGGGVSLKSARIIVVDKTTTGDADATTITAGLAAVAALSPAPSPTAPATVRVRDAATYTEDLTIPAGVKVDAGDAIVNGAHSLARGAELIALELGDKGSGTAPMITGDGGVTGQRRVFAKTISAPTSASRPVVGVASNSEFGEILVRCVDYKASLAPTISVGSSVSFGNLSLGFICDRIRHEAAISTYVHIDCDSTVATTRCHFEAKATADIGSLDSTGGLFQLAGGIHTIDMGAVSFKSGGTNLLATMTGGTLSGRIGRIENWNSPNAISGTGLFEVEIENERDLGYDHPVISQYAASLEAYYPCDEASGSILDGEGSNDGTVTGTIGYDRPGPNAGAKSGPGRSAIYVPDGSGNRVETGAQTALTGAMSLSYWVRIPARGDVAGHDNLYSLSDSAVAITTTYHALAIDSATQVSGAGDGDANISVTRSVAGTAVFEIESPYVYLDDGNWHHVLETRDASGNHALYIDGKLVKSSSTGDTTDLSAAPLRLSVSNTSSFGLNDDHPAAWSEFRIYSTAVDAEFARVAARMFDRPRAAA